ncbi:hypothetical protein AAHC03_025788 [Spirometra sp. Aus1]
MRCPGRSADYDRPDLRFPGTPEINIYPHHLPYQGVKVYFSRRRHVLAPWWSATGQRKLLCCCPGVNLLPPKSAECAAWCLARGESN